MFPARRYPHILCLAANEKDFSLLLEMTIRETVLSDAEALLLRARNDECGRKAEMLEAAATISQSPLFPQNIPAFLKIGAVNKAVSHRYCLLFHTAKHRAAARWISLKIKGFPLIFYKFEEKW